jgi:hypothetical protein
MFSSLSDKSKKELTGCHARRRLIISSLFFTPSLFVPKGKVMLRTSVKGTKIQNSSG